MSTIDQAKAIAIDGILLCHIEQQGGFPSTSLPDDIEMQETVAQRDAKRRGFLIPSVSQTQGDICNMRHAFIVDVSPPLPSSAVISHLDTVTASLPMRPPRQLFNTENFRKFT